MEADGGEQGNTFTEGQYLRVYGRLKEFSGKRHVGAHSVRLITDHNEISFHLLEAAYVHLYYTRGPPETMIKPEGGGGMFVDQNPNRNNQAPAAGGLGAFATKSMTPIARKVLMELHNAPQNNEGLHIRQISASLKMQVSEVYKGCDELLGMGIIYTTIDEETFAVLEC